jgi:hypothetical protein
VLSRMSVEHPTDSDEVEARQVVGLRDGVL